MTKTTSIYDETFQWNNHLPESFDFWEGEPLSQEIWTSKYRQSGEANMLDTIDRVVGGIYAKDTNQTAQANAIDCMHKGLFLPGGRIIAGAGTDKRVTLFNCFDEQELLMTEAGLMDFSTAQGPTEVLTAKGWVEADIKRFGVQHVHTYTFAPRTKDGRGGQSNYRRKVVATPDHRWILTSGKETTALDVGMCVPACAYTGEVVEEKYREGFKHGIVFGDGTHTRTTLRQVGNGYPLGTMHFAVRLCGAKADYLPWFDGENVTYPPSSKGDPHVFLHTMEDLKATPTGDKSPDYLKGFIDGWAAMDGGSSIAGEHSKAIFSKNRQALDWLCDHAPFAGYIPVGNRRFSSGETNYGGKDELWVATIREVAYVEWECVSIDDYGQRPVMCAVVPGEAAFTLAGGIYTGNCYVNETIEDSMEGIHRGYGNVMFTMQQGGGIGTDFTPIRPDGAWLGRTQAPASGPIPFAKAQNAIGETVESAGERRGAQMGTLADFHPDLVKWINLKNEAGVMTQFNISILVSDAFMMAVAEDEEWLLYHAVAPRKRDPELEALDFWDEYTDCQAYVYAKWRARELWDMITRHTYEYSEPGIIFIDRVNELNNLYYREQIRCTNPCVTGDTLILTSEGHRPIQDLVGKEVSVWNGNAWSKVTPYSTGVNSLMEITFSNGQTVRCTPYHKWVLSNGDRVEARDLKVQAKLQFCELPDIQGSVDYAVAPKGVARVGHRVVAIRHLQHVEETFCLTEPKNNTFIANGVLTGNCGEQPLPPNACCNLGAGILATMVKNPFTDDAEFDYELLRRAVHVGVRFLDNVTDVTLYPLEQQRAEQEATRRIGLGFTGLATAMALMGIRYGSAKAVRFAGEVTHKLAYATYEASQALAEERGPFPEYNEKAFWHDGNNFAAQRFKDTPLFGKPMRNGVLNTIAPVGTGSIVAGNIDSALEPIFLLEYDRKVRQRGGDGNTYKTTRTQSMTKRLWDHLHPGEEIPRYVQQSTANNLKVHEHIGIQEACQHWIDASISKTINVPKEMSYEEFKEVYTLAYEAGLKGCTTYRPSEVRGSILSSGDAPKDEATGMTIVKVQRPGTLDAMTAKVVWPALNSSAYLTLSRLADGTPYEMFLHSKDQRNNEWMTTATLFISWLLRQGTPLEKIAEELKQVHSMDGYIVEGKYRPSLISFIGEKLLEMDFRYHNTAAITNEPSTESQDSILFPARSAGRDQNDQIKALLDAGYAFVQGVRCRSCNSPRIVRKQGCEECIDCGHSKCG